MRAVRGAGAAAGSPTVRNFESIGTLWCSIVLGVPCERPVTLGQVSLHRKTSLGLCWYGEGLRAWFKSSLGPEFTFAAQLREKYLLWLECCYASFYMCADRSRSRSRGRAETKPSFELVEQTDKKKVAQLKKSLGVDKEMESVVEVKMYSLKVTCPSLQACDSHVVR